MSEKPEKYYWKKEYTILLLCNAAYVIGMYVLMKILS